MLFSEVFPGYPRLTVDTLQSRVPPAKQQPKTHICGKHYSENKNKKSRDPIRYRECRYRIIYRRRTERLVVFGGRRNVFVSSYFCIWVFC
ncbi:DNA-directed RNA polymerases I, II, and III subunit RPABC4-like [Molossus molossus]|uniref:DNA-directed RNA polymerases I, II, and III subunit RPABC4-like n=1 Tax=Molossus molossus TaxID=27622 RepID=UPI0017476FE1|nr:DNA-directed RNA polymerases I, II, and III subunit RPABC4-like [Molossus molossus]